MRLLARLPVSLLAVTLLAITLVGLVGCKPALIPGSQIEDTDENRKVLEFLTRYQRSVQERNVDGIVALCAADYYEDNGNTDASDDYSLDGLKKRLTESFGKTKELQLDVFVQLVDRTNQDKIAVAYRYNTKALVAFPAGDKWVTATEVNRIVLRPVDGDFRIVSGL